MESKTLTTTVVMPCLKERSNYSNWKYRIQLIIDDRGLSDVWSEKEDDQKKENFQEHDRKAKLIIAQCLSDKYLDIVKKASSAKEMLVLLDSTFERKSVISKLHLKKQLLSLKCKTEDNLQDHFLKFDSIVNDLIAAGCVMDDTDKVCHLLLTMPSEYEHVITAIETLNTDSQLTVEFAKNRLLDAEIKLKTSYGGSHQKFTSTLKKKGLTPLMSDSCIFKNSDSSIILGIYVDDGLLIGNDKIKMKSILEKLREDFQMTYEDNPTTYLNIELERDETTLKLGQKNYVEKILEKFRMNNAKACKTPISKDGKENETLSETEVKFPYREAVGSLLYLSNQTRPDLAYAVNYESRDISEPTSLSIVNVKRTLRYLKGTQDYKIGYNKHSDLSKIVAFCDADFANDVTTRKSTTGYVIMYCGGPIQWASRKQSVVALSSCEAEYVAAAECCKDLIYVKSMIEELLSIKCDATLNIDNQSAMKLIENGVVKAKRSKHIDVRFHFIHDKVKNKELRIEYCPSDIQTADLLTKPLEAIKFKSFAEKLMYCIYNN